MRWNANVKTILADPFLKEGSKSDKFQITEGIGLMPLKTTLLKNKITNKLDLNQSGLVQQKLMDLRFIMG